MVDGYGLLQRHAQGVRIAVLLGGLGPCQRLLKLAHIEAERRIRAPLQRLGVCVHKMASFRECLLQAMHQLAQVGARLGFGRVRPEQKGEVVASLGCIAMEHEIGQQRSQARRVNVADKRCA
ncbi:MAG TPA: hypothetical protein VGT44_20665 [Ktedonobacteraceae bacterium]|nr:hypothetical protein [Ktedonobacteraceae bacterium]